MSGPSLFLAVRFPGIGVVLGRHTAAVEGGHADAGVLTAAVDSKGVQYTMLAAVRGFTPAQVEALRADLEASYGSATVLRRDGEDTLLRYTWSIRDLKSPTLQALVRLQHAFGLPWARVEQGQVVLLAAIHAGERGLSAVENLKHHLKSAGIPADVNVRELSLEQHVAYERMRWLLADGSLQE